MSAESIPEYDTATWTVQQHLNEACRLVESTPEAESAEEYDAARADNLATAQAHIGIATALILASQHGYRLDFTVEQLS